MRQPTIWMCENLRWTRSGVVWADYILRGADYGLRPDVDKYVARNMHKMLLRALPGQSTLLGIAATTSSDAIVARMTENVDLNQYPDWLDECAATLEYLDTLSIGGRIFWLSVPLPTDTGEKGGKGAKRAAKAMWTSASDFLGLPRVQIPDEEIMARLHQAERIAALIPDMFDPQPVTPAQMVWLWERSLNRGLYLDKDLPDRARTPGNKAGAALMSAMLDEGAQSDLEDTGSRLQKPSLSRVLKITKPHDLNDEPASYQVFLTLADTPAGGVLFPGSEFFTLADALGGVDVDYAIRFDTTAGADVMKANKKALRNINEQYMQREGELATGESILDVAASALSEYVTLLEQDHQEVEVKWAAVFALGAHTEELALEYAKKLAKAFEQQYYRVIAPIGMQQELFWAMTPGAAKPRVLPEFEHITTSEMFSAYVPCMQNELGDLSGPLLALNITSQRVGVVHHDVAAKSLQNVSGSFAITGELGSGKSVTLKVIAGNFVDRGGQVIGIDQTELGEYALWADAVTSAVVVDMVEPEYSIDPLRIFPPQLAAETMESWVLSLLRIQPGSPQGKALSKVLDPAYRELHPYAGSGELLDHLLTDCEIEHAADLGEDLRGYARKSFAAAVFAKGLPPLPLDAPAIFFRTHRVKLPTQAQTAQAHLFETLSLEKRYGHAVYTLVARLARGLCFADPTQPALFLVDEAHHLLSADDGIEIISDFVLQGRKESAYVGLGDQECSFGSEKLRGLIKIRIAHRHTDKTLAGRAMEWIGLDHTDPGVVKDYMEQTSPLSGKDGKVEPHRRGEAYMRDASGNIGFIKVLLPNIESRAIAVSTTPKGNKRPILSKAAEEVSYEPAQRVEQPALEAAEVPSLLRAAPPTPANS